MADDELDSLYSEPPDAFTARRTELAAAARGRGDAEAAQRISAARKPTTAAWVVNRLALQRKDTKERLTDLGDRLRAAHASMDGDAIRDLSAEQHRLINELARAALEEAGMKSPSAALRDDLTGTLQAAIADPDVRERLGRLSKPERWSGFGTFGDAVPVAKSVREGTTTPKATAPARPPRPKRGEPPRDRKAEAAERQLQKLRDAVAAAERAKAHADDELSEREAECTAAQRRRDDALASLRNAERELKGAEHRYDKARQSSRAAAESLKEAKAQLRRA
ncbi:hypothetical protein A5791_17930 [Mycobacterium sp. 852002-51163_SCH5372311]|uniref:hypothetical protein n=1 Tax=Mycobacterium sp. 852002-51163_SCH5372311 TaxID=1834097 RepID=UPI0007FDD180|nr:hypothetical protein [Mycobacterium sp. 852002-51163_SCH5372311]OBF88081.1 hypothetical protein A5791_17930 [Mycobacterium sp. 852002-51163_SCH5372311]